MKENKRDLQSMIVDTMHTGNILDKFVTDIIKEFGITHVQFNILRILQSNHPNSICIGDIKKREIFANSDLTRLINRLFLKQLVHREINESNRRQVNVSLSKSGLNLLKTILPKLEKKINDQFKGILSTQELQIYSATLQKIKQNLLET